MSISDLKNKLFTRQQPGNADPAHAYGSQEQIMAEFQRQEYVQPKAPRRSAADRAGAVLSSLRDRISSPPRQYETNAPVYSADTYQQPAAPDLGWEAAFDPNAAPPRREAPAAAPTAQERFEAFRNTVYASPVPRQDQQPYGSYPGARPAPVYEEISFSSPARRESAYQKPVYEELDLNPAPPRQSAYQKPVYEELDLSGRRREYAPAPPEAQQTVYVPEAPQQVPETPPIQGGQAHAAAMGSDFQYFFWSVSILTGAALTLFSFIYACML